MTPTSLTMYETAGAGFSRIPAADTGLVTTGQSPLEPSAQQGDWHDLVVARLAELERLAPAWDGEGGLPVSRKHANRAIKFISRVAARGPVPLPDIVPLADGGVQVEWHVDDQTRVDFVSDDDSNPMVLTEIAGDLVETLARTVEPETIRAALTQGVLSDA